MNLMSKTKPIYLARHDDNSTYHNCSKNYKIEQEFEIVCSY